MNDLCIRPSACVKPAFAPTIRVSLQQGLAAWTALLLLMFAGISQAAPFGVGLAIENKMDSNGNITVVDGSKLRVAFEVDDPDKLSNKADKIQLVRVATDEVVSSVATRQEKIRYRNPGC